MFWNEMLNQFSLVSQRKPIVTDEILIKLTHNVHIRQSCFKLINGVVILIGQMFVLQIMYTIKPRVVEF